MKIHDLKTIVIDHESISYFYTREKNDINGNPRFKVFIIDPETLTVYETIIKTYESLLSEAVRRRIEERRALC